MTPKLFTGLAVAAAGTLVLAALVHASSDRWSSGAAGGAKLLPSLVRDAPRVQTLTIKQAAQSITLERKGEAWSLKDRGGYPVQAEKVRALMVKLADAELVSPKTRSAEKFSLLELEDPAGKDAKSRQVTIADDKGKPIADIIVGKRSAEQFGTGKGGTYVRRPGENETWLVNAEIDASPAVNQWVDTTILEADIQKVTRVTSEAPGQPKLVIEREAGKPANKDAYKLADMPEGKKLKYEYSLEDIVNAFARLEFEDVRKPVAAAANAPAPAVAVFDTDGGTKITLKVRSEGEKRWATAEATGEGDAKAAADKINARANGWEFALPTYKYDQIFKKPADLIEDAQKK